MGYEESFLGLLASLAFVGLTGFYPGGIIVPSYLVLFVDEPARLAGTLIIALLTLMCYRMASYYLIIFGTRRFVFMILMGGLWTSVSILVAPALLPRSLEFRIIGWIVPGLIANNYERQGILVTTAAVVTVTVAVHFLGGIIQGLA